MYVITPPDTFAYPLLAPVAVMAVTFTPTVVGESTVGTPETATDVDTQNTGLERLNCIESNRFPELGDDPPPCDNEANIHRVTV